MLDRSTPTCCGFDMTSKDVFGIRIWTCYYRSHHPRIYENLYTGERDEQEKDSY